MVRPLTRGMKPGTPPCRILVFATSVRNFKLIRS